MQWMNPSGGWALLSLAAILALYILKQRVEPLEVSSTYLWRKAAASLEADQPFQKLRRNLLLFLQLLLALLLCLSLMRPMTPGSLSGEVILVFDVSASMQATTGDETRLEAAQRDALRRVDGLIDGSRVSVLAAGAQVSQLASRSQDLTAVRRTISSIACENGGADLPGALSLAFALQRELDGADVVLYSDQAAGEGVYTQPALGPGLANQALASLQANETTAIARVANYGPDADITVECYADGELVDLRTVSVPAGESASVRFDVPEGAARLEARLSGDDALAADDIRLWARRDSAETTVVLAGRDNVFIEKALALRPDIQLRKTSAAEADAADGAALTVLDGPGEPPQNGALLLIDPSDGVGALRETPTALSAAKNDLARAINAYLAVEDIQIARWRPVLSGTPIWLADVEPVLTIEDDGERLIARLGFDVHDASLPVLKEFPLFVRSLLSYLAPEPLGADLEDAACGDALTVTPQSQAQAAHIRTPSGREIALDTRGETITDTDEIGVYELVQRDMDNAVTSVPFALHIPAAESDVRDVPPAREEASAAGRATFGREWTPWLLLLLLALTLLEWWVYRRGI